MLFEERQARKNNRYAAKRKNESAKTASCCLDLSRIWSGYRKRCGSRRCPTMHIIIAATRATAAPGSRKSGFCYTQWAI